ncbi:hypothetical protein QR98_0034730 [Sarcoptes scabiei]|uniref:NadR/Ttd14 AAA domain-containing protein n=1 Tax=Sarcoptes scabiei TaxID=52283 RepID=A0A132A259_SARSC|nr:hypothetical protein QR98_0034730 [Sarcoptes scabiei]
MNRLTSSSSQIKTSGDCGKLESLMIDPSQTSLPSPSPPPLSMNHNHQQETDHIVYRLALTGGPCSGKTTGQARISTFFENLGWKVYRVPETATTLFRTFFTLAQTCNRNCLIICDRGVMDATACKLLERE